MYGAEKVIQNLLEASKDASYETKALVIEGSNDAASGLRNSLVSSDFDYIVSSKKFDFSVIKKIKSITNNNEIVHTHDYKSLVLASLALFFKNNKIVHHIHGNLSNTLPEKIYAFIESIFIRNVNKVITVSHDQKQYFQNKIGMKSKVIQIDNGTEIFKCKEYTENEKFIIMMAARFTPEKHHKMAIDITQKLIAKKYDIELVLLGDGPEVESIKQYVEQLELINAVKFVGFSKDVKKWLELSDVLLITSTTEGLPMSMLEAMACGVPIVSTPVGEIPSILEKSGGGWVASEVNDFYETFNSILTDKKSLKVAGENAYSYATDHLSAGHQLKCIQTVYEEVSGMSYEYRSV